MKSGNQNGLSLVEMTVYIALMAILSSVIVGLFAAGEKVYTIAWRQTSILGWARQALEGGGNPHGMIWEGRQAQTVTALSAASLSLMTPDSAAPQFLLSGTNLQTVQKGTTSPVAQRVNSLQVTYYNLNPLGHIVISTSPALATMITAQVQMQGIKNKTYTFYTGAQMRNHT